MPMRPMSVRGAAFALLLLNLATALLPGGEADSAANAEAGFVRIWNGTDLAGWDGDPAFWSVRDGAITGQTTAENPTKGNTFLIWRQGEIDDFELRLSYRIVGGNSGIQYRSKDHGNWVVGGYQADFEAGDGWSGTNYEEKGRGTLAKRGQQVTVAADGRIEATGAVGDAGEIQAGIRKEDWNEYAIIAVGNKLVQKINGRVTSEVTDDQEAKRALSGILALQLHAGPAMLVQFKDIRLKRLPLKDRRKIVLVAGNNSHGNGEHEFEAGVSALRKCLDQVPGVQGADYYRGWPTDPTAFDNADAILLYMDGGGGHPMIQPERLKLLDGLIKKGVGMACVHYACEVPADRGGPELMAWIGGYYETGWSINPHWDADFTALPEHEITRGVKPFKLRDEWYYNMRFRPEMKDVTPILRATPPDDTRGTAETRAHPGREETMAWAAKRDDGGRGFGFTGGHFHRNWADEDFRRLVLNGLLWVARAEVPAEGVRSSPTEEELNGRLRGRAAGAGGAQGAFDPKKATFASPIVKSGSIDIDVDITNAKQLLLVVGDGGDGFGCDWADWIDPVLVSPAGETSLRELKWTAAKSGWGEVRIDLNAGGQPMKVDGKPVSGIGVHSESVITFDIAGKGFTRFKAKGGVDNGGTDQNGGTSVQFMVFAKP